MEVVQATNKQGGGVLAGLVGMVNGSFAAQREIQMLGEKEKIRNESYMHRGVTDIVKDKMKRQNEFDVAKQAHQVFGHDMVTDKETGKTSRVAKPNFRYGNLSYSAPSEYVGKLKEIVETKIEADRIKQENAAANLASKGAGKGKGKGKGNKKNTNNNDTPPPPGGGGAAVQSKPKGGAKTKTAGAKKTAAVKTTNDIPYSAATQAASAPKVKKAAAPKAAVSGFVPAQPGSKLAKATKSGKALS
jgi:hypothetical protein